MGSKHFILLHAGKKAFLWLGPKPLVYISEPDLVKEVLNKFHDFQKPRGGNPLSALLVTGLIDAEGDRWTKHRRIINPAFHLEKLKVILGTSYLHIFFIEFVKLNALQNIKLVLLFNIKTPYTIHLFW